MNRVRFTMHILTTVSFILVLTAMAQAQATRTWVSGVGDDVNPCSRTAPCKTFAGAISKTAAGGEISVLDPGGYGTLTITKSITVNGTGTHASTLAALTNGFIVNANAASDIVVLRNIEINGVGTGLDGIRYLAAKELHVENCTIAGFTGDGIDVSLTARGELFVKNTDIRRITGAASSGIKLTTTFNLAFAQIESTRIERVANGVLALNNSVATIHNSIVSLSDVAAIKADATGAGIAELDIKDCIVSFSTVGIQSGTTVNNQVRFSDNMIRGNGTGVSSSGGATISFGNNELTANGINGVPTQTISKL